MSRFVQVFSVAVLSLGLASGVQAASYSFSTADNPIYEGAHNQGWWNSNNASNSNAISDSSVFTGKVSTDPEHRSFFTFDLSGLSLAANEEIASVRFSGNSFGVSTSDDGVETIAFFDVSTSAALLNEHLGSTAGIFDDLGSGNLYGFNNFFNSDAFSDFEVDLNALAYADVLAAQGGYFSIGAAVLSLGVDNFEHVFGLSGQSSYNLTIETRISAVPLPAALPLYGAGLAVMGFIGWRKRQKKANA